MISFIKNTCNIIVIDYKLIVNSYDGLIAGQLINKVNKTRSRVILNERNEVKNPSVGRFKGGITGKKDNFKVNIVVTNPLATG